MRKGGTVYHFTQKTYFGGKGEVDTSVGAHFGGLLEEYRHRLGALWLHAGEN